MSSSRVPPSPMTQQASAAPQPAHVEAASPPSKRDLKSWWKGFKKEQPKEESKGANPSHEKPSIFLESPMVEESAVSEMNSEVLREFLAQPTSLKDHFKHDDTTSHTQENNFFICRALPILFEKPFLSLKKKYTKLMNLGESPSHIWGVPLRQSITYANVAISLQDAQGKSYIYGYVPIVVAKCGVYLKEHGMFAGSLRVLLKTVH